MVTVFHYIFVVIVFTSPKLWLKYVYNRKMLGILIILSYYPTMYSHLYFGKCHSKYSRSEIPPPFVSDSLSNLENSVKKLNRKSLGACSQEGDFNNISCFSSRKTVFHNLAWQAYGTQGRESVTQDDESKLGFYRTWEERDILIRHDFIRPSPKYYFLFII